MRNTPENRIERIVTDLLHSRRLRLRAGDAEETEAITAAAVRAFVFRQGEGVTAVSNMCSHLPCELWWDRGPKVLQCPCHPVSFFPDGKPTSPTYPLPSLNEVQARVSPEGRVEVLGT